LSKKAPVGAASFSQGRQPLVRSVPGSVWDRTATEALPRIKSDQTTRQAEPAQQCIPRQSLGTRASTSLSIWDGIAGGATLLADEIISPTVPTVLNFWIATPLGAR